MSPEATRRATTAPDLGILPPKRPPLIVVGIFIFLGSELMFFASLFGMYFTLRAQAAVWPPADIDLGLLRPTIFTAVLVASSFTMQTADRRIKRGDVAGMKRWIWLTFALGVVFLCGQFWDYFHANFGISTNAYGSAFVTMTGFHAIHVIAGLLVMLVVLGRAATGAYDAENHGAVEAATYYWHFVDVVWIALYTVLFLIR
jgi:cytochrome c oxidase subunit III